MGIISRYTIATLIEIIATKGTKADLQTLFFKYEVPFDIFLKEDTKKVVALKGMANIEKNHPENIEKIIKEVVSTYPLGDEERERLEKALLQDGYTPFQGKLLSEPLNVEEERNALEVLIGRNRELSEDILLHHLKQNIHLYKDGRWDSSIGQARNLVEQILGDIAKCIASTKKEQPDISKPVLVRNYLESSGFLGSSERKRLVDGVYGYFSEEGSHPGISEQSTARVARNIMLSFGFYILEKFENWKSVHQVIDLRRG